MNVAELTAAIDVHTHAEISASGHLSLKHNAARLLGLADANQTKE